MLYRLFYSYYYMQVNFFLACLYEIFCLNLCVQFQLASTLSFIFYDSDIRQWNGQKAANTFTIQFSNTLKQWAPYAAAETLHCFLRELFFNFEVKMSSFWWTLWHACAYWKIYVYRYQCIICDFSSFWIILMFAVCCFRLLARSLYFSLV